MVLGASRSYGWFGRRPLPSPNMSFKLMGINGAGKDPEDPYEVKNCYQNWETCMAANLQLVFYRNKKTNDILVKCLLNGEEATLPVATDKAPYYRWSDLRDHYKRTYENISGSAVK